MGAGCSRAPGVRVKTSTRDSAGAGQADAPVRRCADVPMCRCADVLCPPRESAPAAEPRPNPWPSRRLRGMREHDVFVFLLSLAVVLSVARLLGEGARRLGFPLIFGELASGILLGPTVLGRISPAAQHGLFPGGVPSNMLAGYTNVGVVLLLTVAGLEVNLGIVRRRGRSALLTSLMGIVMPLAGGVLLGVLLPDSDLMRPDRRLLFALFMGVALSISALPVIAKTLLDLGLFKTDVGLLVMAAAMIDDLVGWLAFSVLLGPMQGGALNLGSVARSVALTVGFVVVSLLIARPLLGRLVAHLQADHHSGPRRVLSLI